MVGKSLTRLLENLSKRLGFDSCEQCELFLFVFLFFFLFYKTIHCVSVVCSLRCLETMEKDEREGG